MFLFRRFPILGWLLVGWLVFALIQSAGTGAASIVGFGLLLPLFLLKMLFFFMVIGFVFRMVGGGHGHWHHERYRERGPRGRNGGRDDERRPERDPEWERNVRDARDELDEMFPDDPTARFPDGPTVTV